MTTDSASSWFLQLLDQHGDNELRRQITSFHESVVRRCRDSFALQDARDIVPIADLVQNNLDILEGNYQDNLLPVLTGWFCNEFFSWFHPPACEKCASQLTQDGLHVNPEGLQIESYKCNNTPTCKWTFDFIRHTDPAILLRTRRGRCGEWANCFFLILRALDYDARIVLDTTDHVWNEVWSESRQQWIHVDPCENVVDCPLLYELGWSKKLKYCIAFSRYEVIDVTRRYSKDMNSIRENRYGRNATSIEHQQQELWLTNFLNGLTMQAVKDLDQNAKDTILRRRAIDIKHLQDLETNGRPEVDASKLGGRKTGSMAWRIARGEYSPIMRPQHVIKVQPLSEGPGDALFSFEYDCDRNVYLGSAEDVPVNGWQNLVYAAENIDHKFERDWKTSYLARYESCAPDLEGKIHWRFDTSSVVSWVRLEVRIQAKTWPNTRLEAQLICNGPEIRDGASVGCASVTRELRINEANVLTFEELKTKVTGIDLIIILGGGEPNDNVAWQKPQLFRQERASGSSQLPLSLKIF